MLTVKNRLIWIIHWVAIEWGHRRAIPRLAANFQDHWLEIVRVWWDVELPCHHCGELFLQLLHFLLENPRLPENGRRKRRVGFSEGNVQNGSIAVDSPTIRLWSSPGKEYPVSRAGVLKRLHSIGFRRWYIHHNHQGRYMFNGTTRTCCYEMVYVNYGFLRMLNRSSHAMLTR